MLEEEIKKLRGASESEKRDAISKLGIYELRGLARALGVVSPTTKKRDYLIDAILELINNDNIEIVKKNNKGRPCKKLESINGIINLLGDEFMNKEIVAPKTYSYDEVITFAQEIPVYEYKTNENTFKRGVLRIFNQTVYFMDLFDGTVVYVPDEFIKEYNLKLGDYLETNAFKINQNNQFTVREILKINLCDVRNYFVNPNSGIGMKKILPKQFEKLGNQNILVGARNLFFTEDLLYLSYDIDNILTSLDDGKRVVLFLGLNLPEEDQMFLSKFNNVLPFYTTYGKDGFLRIFDVIVDAINFAERLIKINKNVVIVVDDVVALICALDHYFNKNDPSKIYGHISQTAAVIEKLISIAAAYENGTSCSTIFICNDIDKNDDFVRNQIVKLCKKMN